MNRVWVFLFVVVAAVAAVVLLAKTRQTHEMIPWRTDFAAASAEARGMGKPILVDFWATWCGPCQEMRRTTWSDPKVAAAMKDFVPVEIDVDKNGELAGQYGVQSIPHLVLLTPEGKEIRTNDGFLDSDQFLDWLRQK